ncbi:uncharacterized protein LOC124202102 [Daphnia pulex]|uniref:uncharacterized protein LOC124202102 n=1 Tax=Daphnia pulex TaxID=6669 RepID=UPI001EDE6A6C|nr:uncharacterized protein LOC124202102 [Daphnia pulex]XP_046454329.1 uncharacterized protein LOC124202102 [Daphnia pulex]
MASKTIPIKNQEKDSQKSQIPRALSLIKRGMAFMKRNSPLRSNQLRRTSSDSGPSVRPKKWADLDRVQLSSEQDCSKSPKPSKSPIKLVKPVSNTKKLITRQSPYSYCARKPQPSRIPVRRCISVTPIGERIASLESEESELMERLNTVREKLEHLKELRYNNMFVYRMNHRPSSNQKMPKIEESDLESLGSPSFAYLRPLKPRRVSIKNDHQS